MNITFGKVDSLNWKNRFAWIPEVFRLSDGGLVTVWLESYKSRDIDSSREEIILRDGRFANSFDY